MVNGSMIAVIMLASSKLAPLSKILRFEAAFSSSLYVALMNASLALDFVDVSWDEGYAATLTAPQWHGELCIEGYAAWWLASIAEDFFYQQLGFSGTDLKADGEAKERIFLSCEPAQLMH